MVSEVVSLPTTVHLHGNCLMDNIREIWIHSSLSSTLDFFLRLLIQHFLIQSKWQRSTTYRVQCILLLKEFRGFTADFPLEQIWLVYVGFYCEQLECYSDTWDLAQLFSSGQGKQCLPKTALACCELNFFFCLYLACAASGKSADKQSRVSGKACIIEADWTVSKSETGSRG